MYIRISALGIGSGRSLH